MNQDDILANPSAFDLSISCVGEPTLESPMLGQRFVDETTRVSLSVDVRQMQTFCGSCSSIPSLEIAGPRQRLFHDPAWSRAAIVTCGGLCPGLNIVIKGIVQTLYFDYGVRNIFGLRYGYRGLNPQYGLSPIKLDPETVDSIHEDGGTILGSSRGNQDVGVMVDT